MWHQPTSGPSGTGGAPDGHARMQVNGHAIEWHVSGPLDNYPHILIGGTSLGDADEF
jgi:hypothetical protein